MSAPLQCAVDAKVGMALSSNGRYCHRPQMASSALNSATQTVLTEVLPTTSLQLAMSLISVSSSRERYSAAPGNVLAYKYAKNLHPWPPQTRIRTCICNCFIFSSLRQGFSRRSKDQNPHDAKSRWYPCTAPQKNLSSLWRFFPAVPCKGGLGLMCEEDLWKTCGRR